MTQQKTNLKTENKIENEQNLGDLWAITKQQKQKDSIIRLLKAKDKEEILKQLESNDISHETYKENEPIMKEIRTVGGRGQELPGNRNEKTFGG